MSDVKQLALEVFEGREEAEKRIPKVVVENLEDYVKKIIEIFKISNSSEKSTVLVWQIRLVILETKQYSSQNEKDYCFLMISFEQDDNAEFSNTLVFGSEKNRLGDNTELVEYIKKLEIPKEFFEDIYNYFRENLSEYFETTKEDSKHIRIKLISKEKSTC